jgi:hypothetical protein
MAGSYEKINYSLRPAKSIERKMLCDAFRRLSAFGKVENYQYIGFGSTYFSDFSLFHKALGISNKEIRHLDTQLPIKEDELPTLSAVPKEDIEKSAKMYRYFPTFTETDI